MATSARRDHQRSRGDACDPGRVKYVTPAETDPFESPFRKVAAIVPAYLAEGTIEATLRALRSASPVAPDVIFVVGSPGDRTTELVERFVGVRAISPLRRLSAGAARNLGALIAVKQGCDALLFVDADCRVAPRCLESLVRALASGDCVAAGAEVVRDGGGLVARLRHALEFKESDGSAPPGAVVFVPSATILCSSAVFQEVGGFPDMWPGEDLVFCDALVGRFGRNAVARVAEAKCYHQHPRGWWNMAVHQYRLGRTSALARRRTRIRGSAWAQTRLAAPLLAVARTVRALQWFARYKRDELAWMIAVLPIYAALIGVWALGFAAGCGGRLEPHPGSAVLGRSGPPN